MQHWTHGFSVGRIPSVRPSSLWPVDRIRPVPDLSLLLKALYLPGYALYYRLLSCITEGAGLLLFSGSFLLLFPVTRARSLPFSFACRQRHIYVVLYSGGLFRVHNVVASFTGFTRGYLGLSNTSITEKTLSLPKPPHG